MMFRLPKTNSEARMTALHLIELEEFGIKVRPSRHPNNLPNSYDDDYRSDAVARSWKNNRRTQYRAA